MSDRNGRVPAAWAVAVGGVFVGHGLAYLAVQPQAQARAGLLAATGHGYLSGAADAAAILAVAAAAWIFLVRLSGRFAPELAFRSRYVRVAIFQVVAYTGLEVAERLGGGLGSLPAVLAAGLVAQLAVAALVTWAVGALLRFADRAGELAGAALDPPAGRAVVLVPPAANPHSRRHAGSSAIRAPPFGR